ncbi:hypothetical protein RJ639_006349 [Escallonia herrerae]|uniref:F-box domain-containing protein n=1 Tax=Escallonia herrerae TaxID=1293975 RepID=A0AA88VXC9_9ASTE|nr:hypothetical protein RJ639_006349 [Escallonia herrerae]
MEANLDLISTLPQEVLLHIVSFLPLKEAVRSSVLSTSWKSLWTRNNVHLDIGSDGIAANHGGVTQVIGEILRSYSCPEMQKLCLEFSKTRNEPDKLTLLATKGVDKELHLDFAEEQQATRTFHLKLEHPSNHFPEIPSFASLKILHLRAVSYLAENMLPAVFSKFVSLEYLKFENCIGLQCLDIKAGGRLKSFTVLDCPDMAELTLSAPNLRSFSYRGALPWIQLKNVDNLADVMLDMADGLGQNEFDCEVLLSLLASLKDVEILSLSGWLLEWLCSAGVIFRQLEFRFSKLKELSWIESSIDKPRRDSMAHFLDICPLLERLFINIDPGRKSVVRPHFHQFWHEPYFGMDYTTLKSSSSQARHLKFVKLAGCSNQEDKLHLLDILLKKSVVLQSMIVASAASHSWQVVKIPLSQLRLTGRGRKQIEPRLSPSKDCYFGFIEEETRSLGPFHELRRMT